MIKGALLKFPWLYERAQGVRDRRFFRKASLGGSFSQHGEDNQILKVLVEAGEREPFLDIGCNHPFRLSNTYLLYRHGWRGVCVDPLPRYRPLFARWRSEDRFVNAAVGTSPGSRTLFEFESDVLSTLDNEVAEHYIKAGYRLRRRQMVHTKTVDGILEEAGIRGRLSFISLDIEGNELDALRSMDLGRWRPRLICIEAKNIDGLINRVAVDFLCERGYKELSFNGLNVILQER
jgi:FkbM family methyltransferase